MTPEHLHKLIVAVADAVIAHADELTELDQAIGDGDHGVNMRRGFEAVRADAAATAEKPLPDALKAIGTQLVMKVGGASGPLYGTLFLALGKTIAPDASNIAAAFAAAVQAVEARGKSHPGQKTLLDVLAPVQAALADGGPHLPARLPIVAAAAADATVPMLATRGRASFLGERSIGHMDPGARSSALMIASLCRALEELDLG
ncbi:dihydroxyacetone kinase DhaL subunit [Roseiarcus fermentans]|uniref:Dihydroxyacetone kinase DhaL subunit n=1 Tax=Roseiarcus fermentans TaxID=1473586 RepID=A0A366F385_9HYPH|nr:dihydroxyacetone kinase subunit DhaL [Roseiarcus fermentans]RBP09057.1 dihydroxyacetone kinase DhaL subunit [Roseiarcus fermentans]